MHYGLSCKHILCFGYNFLKKFVNTLSKIVFLVTFLIQYKQNHQPWLIIETLHVFLLSPAPQYCTLLKIIKPAVFLKQ